MEHRMDIKLILERVELFLVRKLAIDQQIGHFNEGTVLRQVIDGISPIVENTLFPVKKGDLAGAGTGIHETAVQGDNSALGPKTPNINGLLPLATLDDRQFIHLAA